MIRVRVSAASPVVRAGLEALLQDAPLITLVDDGTADVVVVEMHTQLLSTIPIHENKDTTQRPAIVLLAEDPFHDSAAWSAAVRAGARAVLPVGASAEQIQAAVHAAAVGLTTLTPELAGSLLHTQAVERAPLTFVEHLSPREAEILGMLAEGLGNKTIAARLRISRNTVKAHVSAIFAKLGASTRAEAVAIGARSGLIVL
jgi:DNA-binding NarL/FixJ family response regulator